MKNKWKDEEIKTLFDIVEKNNKKNLSVLDSFREYANKTGRNALSVRNFYYTYLKELKNNDDLRKKFNIDINNHIVQKFKHFDDEESKILTTKIDELIQSGLSVRNACFRLAGGNAKEMLRLQNKYRNIAHKQAKVLKFPKQSIESNKNFGGKVKLTDDDIKSLFLGLVKLVKENATIDSKKQVEKILIATENEKRKHLVELEQKQFEISRLNQSIAELKQKNTLLNKVLENYRINYLNNNFDANNLIK